MIEWDIENYLNVSVKKSGGFTRKIEYIGRKGCPDRLVVLNGVHLVELKSPKGRLSPQQEGEIIIFRDHGVKIHVLRSKDEVDRFINEVRAKRTPKANH